MITPALAGDNLRGRRALITGAGRGIGAGIAELLVAAGASVVVNARTETFVGPLVEQLRQKHGDDIQAIIGDASTAPGCRALFEKAELALGGIDILVNALGDAVSGPLVALPGDVGAGMSDEAVMRTLDLNLISTIHALRAAAPGMIERKWGRIITITSGYGTLRGHSGLAIYAAAKAGLVGLSRSLAQEWGRFGITVNTIAPGAFPDPAQTPLEQMAWYEKTMVPQIPIGRLGDVREIGPLAAFLASDAASYISGAEIVVDGGLFA